VAWAAVREPTTDNNSNSNSRQSLQQRLALAWLSMRAVICLLANSPAIPFTSPLQQK